MSVTVLEAELAVGPVSEHAEGPLWDSRIGALLWVDQYAGLVRSARPAATGPLPLEVTDVLDVGAPVGAVVPAASGGWVVAAGAGFHRLAPDGALSPVVDVMPDGGPRRRMNDGKVDPDGRFWAGTMAYDGTPGAGSLYVLERGRAVEVLTGVTISNGLAWTADGRTLYYVDTPTGVVRRYVTRGARSPEDDGVVVRAPANGGAFDGMAIDDEGCLWVALWGAGAVHRYSPGGELLARVQVDAPQVSSCAFGDADRATLYITTSRENYTADDVARHPLAGAVFRVRPGVSGPPAARYED